MPGLLRGVARTAVIAGTATAVSNNVSRRQAGRWAAKDQSAQQEQYEQQQYAQAQYAQQQAAAQAAAAQAAPASDPMQDRIAQLKELASLKEAGILTDAEFDAQKALILGS
jgi:hypothetical protein